jgi:hypothetical protein
VIMALVYYCLEVESGDQEYRECVDVEVEDIVIDNVGRQGSIRYSRDRGGVVEWHKELVVWW